MADNVTLNAGSGGAVIATDDDSTAHHQYVKMEWGADGTFTKVAAGASAVPIQDGGNTITVDGTVSVTGQIVAGTAGTASTDVISVQGIASMTPVQVTINAGTNGIGKLTANTGVDIGDVDVTSVVPGTSATSLGKAEDAAHASGDTGVMLLGVRAATPTDRSAGPTDGDYEPLGINAAGAVWVTPTPVSTGGLSIFRSLDLDETEEEVVATACTVYGAWVTNTATSTRWLKFYNATAASVTVGTTTPVITIGIPGNTSDDISANFGPGGMGVGFSTACTVASTTGVADADTGAPAANDVIVNIFYKA